ncbi:MAG: hypothetical protein GKR89_01705 [Candidatus Latescibacteria bacterium]|nr:hypothetical protein [Candidatus Latescibacterota bacterium]
MVLSPEQRSRFFSDGFIAVENLISPDELATLQGHYTDLATNRIAPAPQRDPSPEPEAAVGHGPHHQRRGTQIFPSGEENFAAQRREADANPLDTVSRINNLSHTHPAFEQMARHPKIVAIVAELMGPDIKLYYDQIFGKPPYDRANRYHQDSVFWGFFASNFQITCQLMLDDSTLENGCIRFIPGSLEYGLIDWDHLPYMLSSEILQQEVAAPLKAGGATFHHSLTLHCSGPNTTAHRRRGWSLHYASAKTRYIGTPEETARIKELGCLIGPEPVNGWPLISGREYPHCI